jgi:hypothetical protein
VITRVGAQHAPRTWCGSSLYWIFFSRSCAVFSTRAACTIKKSYEQFSMSGPCATRRTSTSEAHATLPQRCGVRGPYQRVGLRLLYERGVQSRRQCRVLSTEGAAGASRSVRGRPGFRGTRGQMQRTHRFAWLWSTCQTTRWRAGRRTVRQQNTGRTRRCATVLHVPNAHVGRGARAPGAVPHAGIQQVGEAAPLVFADESSEDSSMDDMFGPKKVRGGSVCSLPWAPGKRPGGRGGLL